MEGARTRMGHTHTWCDFPPEGSVSLGKTWDEQYFDTEALSENSEVKSEDYMLDVLYTLELNPNSRFDEEFWPEVVEWCTGCTEHRRVQFVIGKVLEKVKALDGLEDDVLCKVALEEEIDSAVNEQEANKVGGTTVEEKFVTEELAGKEMDVLGEEVMVGESLGVKVVARSNSILRQSSSPIVPLPSTTPSTFWRPWEASCEAKAMGERRGEATTLLSSEGVTPPALMTPPMEEMRSTRRKVGSRFQRLLDFQATLEKEKGMPPSRWQRRLEFGWEGEATHTKRPVSHRKKGKLRVDMGELEASSPKLREMKVQEVMGTTVTHVKPEYWELETSKLNSLLLHSSLSPGGWDGGGGHRGFCHGCGVWGNIELIV